MKSLRESPRKKKWLRDRSGTAEASGRWLAMALSKAVLGALWVCVLALSAGCTRAQDKPVLEPIGVLELPFGIQSMAWHPNGKWLAVGYFMRDEVEVWDVEAKKPLFAVPSKRRPINLSGQEVLFSQDGNYLVVQDFLDTKNGEPKFPRRLEDPTELPARLDKDRYVLARVWSVAERKEVAQLKGPGSVLYGGVQGGFCQTGKWPDRLIVHRMAVVAVYELSTGKLLFEFDGLHPFADKPDQTRGYWKMACHPTRAEVALEGAQFFQEAPLFGFPARSGATPIVVADLEKNAVRKVLFSTTPLNGVVYTADGSKLISFGATPIRIWNAGNNFEALGEIGDPALNSGLMTPIAAYDGVLGVSNALRIWSTEVRRNVYTLDTKQYDTLRIAVHPDTKKYAVAVNKFAHLYRLHLSELKRQTAAPGK